MFRVPARTLLVPFCAIVLLLAAPAAPAAAAAPPPAGGVYFDDSDPEVLKLGSDLYEVGLRKSNGSIAYITWKAEGGSPTLGSRYECLWGATFAEGASPPYTGGCDFSAAWANRFSYSWNAAAELLTLDYTPDPAAAQRVSARVLVRPSAGASFDMHLALTANWGYEVDYVLFPSDLVFAEATIKEAILPVLPGILLKPAFFAENRSYTAAYPGYPGLFADYVSISTTQGPLAIYPLFGAGPIRPSFLGFIHDEEYVADSTFYFHAFGARLPGGGTFDSPWVRLSVAAPGLDSARAYREDNGLDGFPSLQQKLGGMYAQVAASPLYKADAAQLGLPFTGYAAMLAQVPQPGILHPVAFQPGGHDERYPDFLPPAPAWGTTAEMAAMFAQAQALGFLVMPYTNPTWWDDESPTLTALPPGTTIADVAALDRTGAPIYETYGGTHGGYVISPAAPFVLNRLAQLNQQMTADLPSDLLFEDQIGARPWLYDYNASSPGRLAYMDGWLAHTRAYSPTLLMTELGFDRLGEMEAGFHGSVLLPQVSGYTSGWWGDGTWEPYPLATAMLRDKVLFYQHDLAPETFTTNKATLGWNLAMGYQLSYDLVASTYGGGLASDWLDVVGAFQQRVLAHYADAPITGLMSYGTQDASGTLTVFGSCSALANWDDADPLTYGAHTLPPKGAMARCGEWLTAGIFARYNNADLSAGDHALIEERDAWGVTVRHPLGADTSLTLRPVPGLDPGAPAQALAYAAGGSLLGAIPATVTDLGVTFSCTRKVAGTDVAWYRINGAPSLFLPLVLRNGP